MGRPQVRPESLLGFSSAASSESPLAAIAGDPRPSSDLSCALGSVAQRIVLALVAARFVVRLGEVRFIALKTNYSKYTPLLHPAAT